MIRDGFYTVPKPSLINWIIGDGFYCGDSFCWGRGFQCSTVVVQSLGEMEFKSLYVVFVGVVCNGCAMDGVVVGTVCSVMFALWVHMLTVIYLIKVDHMGDSFVG
jgi:hypothetical protein